MSKLGIAIGISPSFGTGQEGGGISYLLFDDFLTAYTAGNVDGTNAEPTGGARTVVDTDTILAISGGSFKFVPQTTTGWGLHQLKYTAFPRQVGKMLIYKVNRITAAGDFHTGFRDSDGVSDLADQHAEWFSGGGLNVWDTGSFGTHLSVDTGEFIVAILLRSTGAFFYINTAASGVWRLLRVTQLGNSTNVQPYFTTHSSATVDLMYVKIPESLYLPTPIHSDGFSQNATATVTDSGSGAYHMLGVALQLSDGYARFNRVLGISAAKMPASFTHSLIPHGAMSVAIQYRKPSQYVRSSLFHMDKSDGSYVTLHTNQYGDWQYFINGSAFTSAATPDKATVGDGQWHGAAISIDQTGDAIKTYSDGVLLATRTSIGTFTSLNWTTGGSGFGIGTGGSGIFQGDIRHCIITLNGVIMTQTQAEALSDPDTVITTSLLDGYFGSGNYAWYKLTNDLTSDGLGHAETSGLGAGGSGSTTNATNIDTTNARTHIFPSLATGTDILGGDGSMEGTYDDESGGGGGTVNIPPNWNALNVETDGTDTVDKYTSDKMDGSACVKITVDADAEGIEYPLTGLVTDGVWYEAVGFIQCVSGTAVLTTTGARAGYIFVFNNSTVWEASVMRWLSNGAGTLQCVSSGAATFYLDAVTVKEADVASFLQGNSYGTDLYLSADITTGSAAACGLFALCDSLTAPTEMVYAVISLYGTVRMLEMVAGVSTLKAETAITYSAGTKLTLVTNDTSGEIRCYYGTTYIGTFNRDAALTGNTNAGMFSATPDPTFDNFVVYDTTSADSELSLYE